MIVLVAALLAIVTVPLSGGDLRRFADIRLRRGWLIWLCLLVQLASGFAGTITPGAGAWLHVISFTPAGLFVWSNRHLPGAAILAAGGSLNLVAIASNGGVMPARPEAWERAGLPLFTDADFANSMPTADAPLWFLGDVFFIPEGIPLANVFSVGDVTLVIAVAWISHAWCRRSPAADQPERPSAGDSPAPWPPPSIETLWSMTTASSPMPTRDSA